MKRVLTAAALIPVVVYLVLFAPQAAFLAVVALVAGLCYFEYDAIAKAYGFGAPGILGYIAGFALLLWNGETWLLLTITAIVSMGFAMREADLANCLPRTALLMLGILYVFGTWKCAPLLHDANRHWLMYALLVNWCGDIGAYYTGRNFGKHKLAPEVSPKKTWEGAGGSVAASILLAGGYLYYFVHVPVWQVIALTAVANVAGQLGDLAESSAKRGAGVKDSGRLLPGHGGFLDRVDSTLFALPVVYAFVKYAN
jgi:phosphatidate cytidylyltransferase